MKTFTTTILGIGLIVCLLFPLQTNAASNLPAASAISTNINKVVIAPINLNGSKNSNIRRSKLVISVVSAHPDEAPSPSEEEKRKMRKEKLYNIATIVTALAIIADIIWDY